MDDKTKMILRNDPAKAKHEAEKARRELEKLLQAEVDEGFCKCLLTATFRTVMEIVKDKNTAIVLICEAMNRELDEGGDA